MKPTEDQVNEKIKEIVIKLIGTKNVDNPSFLKIVIGVTNSLRIFWRWYEAQISEDQDQQIKRFEILQMMYQSTDPATINHISFEEYAKQHWEPSTHWDNVDMNYLEKTM